jgi:hypothetical protein
MLSQQSSNGSKKIFKIGEIAVLSPLMQEVPRGTLNNKQKCVITIMKRKFKQ